jgi:hypothetical protein
MRGETPGMFAERQARYPKGTYKVVFARQNGDMEFCLVNLTTGSHSHSHSIWELIRTIENDISANKFPQSAIQYRSWASPQQGAADRKAAGKAGTANEINGSTFILKVLYRQNATWQGTIRWMEGRQTRPYRSVNELLKLMDEAADSPLPETEEETEKPFTR